MTKAPAAARLVCLVLLAGCASDGQRRNGDPLIGAAPPAPAPPASLGAPLSASGAPSSNAALASGRPRPLDPTNELRIGPGTQPAQPTPPTVQPVSVVGGTQLRPPVPAVAGVPAVPVPNATAAQLSSYEQAQMTLRGRGVKWQRLEMLGDGDWKFTCSVPSRQNASVSRTYEARGSSFLGAIQTALEQMDREAQPAPF